MSSEMAKPADIDARLVEVLDYLARDLAEQGLKAHLDGKPEASDSLYGFSAACRRAMIDVLGQDGFGSEAAEGGGLLKKLGIV